jgi:hypothetical protein
MARKTASGVNKSQAVRDYLAKNPGATPNQIVAGLKDQGVDVSVGLASNVKYTMGKRRGKVRRRRMSVAQATNGGGRRGRPSMALSMDDLLATKQLVTKVGSAAKVRKALEVLDQLS